MTRPFRSVLYIPASNRRAMEKARGLPADGIIFDLEDAVAPDEKEAARTQLAEALAGDYGPRARILRINALASPWGADDCRFVVDRLLDRIDVLLLPKVNDPDDLDKVAEVIPDLPLWAMMETPRAMLNAAAIAAQGRLQALVMGTNDLAKELNSRDRSDRLPLIAGLGLCLLAARAEGKLILDGVYNAFRDEAGLRAEAVQGRDMGFDGKTLIHPAQLDIANQVFAPSPDEIAQAEREIAAYEAARADGRGVAVLDGRIVENLHVELAHNRLRRAAAIAAMDG
jgi:(3S)-malyl-CoA thioesterase